MSVRQSALTPEAQPINDGADPAVVGPFLAGAFHDERWRTCSIALLAGGYSNLTYAVRSPAGEVILRRPPLGHVLPTAHDMAREYRVMTALGPTAVPVPRTLLLAEADSALGFQCLVMERVAGHICRTALPAGYADAPADRHAIGVEVVDVMADLHLVDVDSVGLGDFGRPDGFMERQLRRWGKQWEASKSLEVPALDRLLADLAAARPPSAQRSLVHGDFRLDNTILHPARPGEITAVLDWELSALGDPLSDLGALLAYWSEEADDDVLVAARVVPPLTAAEGFPTRNELVERYADRTAFDLSGLRWYVAFSYLKIAIICQGIADRVAHGVMIGDGFQDAGAQIDAMITAGSRILATSGTT
jgi:aminoglycoside phosphotransferase (APT) family kinase protein